MSIAIHELGHVVAAVALGWKFQRVVVPGWGLLGVKLGRSYNPELPMAVFGRQLKIITLCGPIANIVLAVIASVWYGVVRPASGVHDPILHVAVREWAIMFVVPQLGGALVNLIPRKTPETNSGNDGYIAFRLCSDEVALGQFAEAHLEKVEKQGSEM